MDVLLFSGGVDSSVAACILRMRGVKFLAVTFDAPFVPRRQMEMARRVARTLGLKHTTLKLDVNGRFWENPPDRCYICKRRMLEILCREFEPDRIYDGTNKDDLNETRPGLKANEEFGVVSPLRGLSKSEVRMMAKSLGLPNWNEPSESCLATRIYGRIEPEVLRMVEEAENFLRSMGFRDVRVRCELGNARIEVEDPKRAFELGEVILRRLRGLGFRRVSIDLEARTDLSLSPRSSP